MGKRNDHDFLRIDPVNNLVRKPRNEHASKLRGIERKVAFSRVNRDRLRRRIHGSKEVATETSTLLLVPAGRFFEFLGR